MAQWTKTPLTWFGGKFYMISTILERIPPHKRYVEIFGGSAAILYAKPRVEVEVYNDLNPGLSNLMSVLKDDELFSQFYRKIVVQPSAREIYEGYKKTWESQTDQIEHAVQWFTINRQCFSGCFAGSWKIGVTRKLGETWFNHVRGLPSTRQRIRHIDVENADWRDLLPKYDDKDTFFYLDPPYVHSERSSYMYDHEMTDDDHIELIEAIQSLKGKVLLSGYHNPIYEKLEWSHEDFSTWCWAAGKTKTSKLRGEGGLGRHQRTEVLWRNFETQLSLF